MTDTRPADLAASMLHLHGSRRAHDLADIYARVCAMDNDAAGFAKWTAAAAKIVEMTDLMRRFG